MNSLMRFFAMLSLSISIFFGCAKPTYLNQHEDDNVQNFQNEAQATCTKTFDQSKYCLIWKWEVQPTETEMASIVFKIYRLSLYDQTPIEINLADNPEVVLWMPSMGHGSSSTEVEKLETGTYRAVKLSFFMPGEWQIKFQLKSDNVVQDEAIVDFTL